MIKETVDSRTHLIHLRKKTLLFVKGRNIVQDTRSRPLRLSTLIFVGEYPQSIDFTFVRKEPDFSFEWTGVTNINLSEVGVNLKAYVNLQNRHDDFILDDSNTSISTLPYLPEPKILSDGIWIETRIKNESQVFVDKLIEIRDSSHIGKSLDYLFQSIYGLLKNRKFEECESLISGVEISRLDEYLMLGLLTATFPWKNRIQQRDGLYDRIEKQLEKSYSPDEVAKMMSGLK
jgi:hypothetical protein